jgi:hypothetical protein
MQPSGLDKKPTEKQDAQDHNDCDKDYLDQTHSKFLNVFRAKTDQRRLAMLILGAHH